MAERQCRADDAPGTLRGDHLEIPVVDNGLRVELGKIEGGNVSPAREKGGAGGAPPGTQGALPATINLAQLLLPLPPAAPRRLSTTP